MEICIAFGKGQNDTDLIRSDHLPYPIIEQSSFLSMPLLIDLINEKETYIK